MPSTIGTRIRSRRKKAGLTIADLAKKTGIDQSQLCKMENEIHGLPGTERLIKICRALDAPMDEVILGNAEAYREKARINTAAIEKAAKEMAGEL